MEQGHIDRFFDAVQGKVIPVIGDAMLDAYIMGKVNRISPEAPVPVVDVQSREYRLGGAANVALNLKALGAEPVLIAALGDDGGADRFTAVMERHDLQTLGLIRHPKAMTTVKTRVFSQRQQMLRLDEEDSRSIPDSLQEDMSAFLAGMLHGHKPEVAVLQDYNKGVLDQRNISALISQLRDAGVKVAVDPKRENFEAYTGIDLLKPNLKETADIYGDNAGLLLADDATAALPLTKQIRRKQQPTQILITLGDRGMFYSEGPNAAAKIPAERREVADVSGAGDTVIAVAAAGMAAGMSINEWAPLANLAGGLVCEMLGVVPIDPQRLRIEAERLA